MSYVVQVNKVIFTVHIDGCSIIYFTVAIAVCVADLVFVLDNSGSIRDNDPPGGNNWQLILDFVKSVVEMLDVRPETIRVAVVDFGRPVFEFSKSSCQRTFNSSPPWWTFSFIAETTTNQFDTLRSSNRTVPTKRRGWGSSEYRRKTVMGNAESELFDSLEPRPTIIDKS